ncbi:phosphoribosyltransferase family protein [Streptomyces cinnabarinus]|uniref:Phosphoribosyltransferase family protein n=1 Tax=Streptomyces cinnabarinus TaxID=67287 RepID=A0ABY7KRV1_9ACTN|nr:phosphoribosyltransferase family protein [Streptomyces cinnabarinus]WAZ25436.1 phosphoribosyltransferase family protein [Streptomyces cinnabarinus]
MALFRDRGHAGRELARELRERGDLADPVVLALPRGGVAVAQEVARALDAPLDVLVARKIGAPFHEEFGVGAICGDDPPVFDEWTLGRLGLTEVALEPVVARERAELRRREQLYRSGRPALDLRGRTVVVVDDGLATGVTARAALRWIRGRSPARVLLVVPVGSPEGVALMGPEADEVICPHRPVDFMAVGLWYDDFEQLTDADVLAALHTGAEGRSAGDGRSGP